MKYICECGKEFGSPQSFNGHKCHCKVHQLAKHGNLNSYLKHKEAFVKKGHLTQRQNVDLHNKQSLQQWISEKHICEHCGKIMTEKFGSGRFCCRACANSRKSSEHQKQVAAQMMSITSNKRKQRIREDYANHPNYCQVCGKALPYEHRYLKSCCKDCEKELIRRAALRRSLGGFNMRKKFIELDDKFLDSSYEYALAKDLNKHNIK